MIKHVVLLNWKDGVSQQQVEAITAGLSQLKTQIPEILSYSFGPDAGISRGNANYALIAEFADEAGLKAYVTHPSHQQFLDKIAAPILKSFQSAQFIV